jgi:hypothetical protein
MCPPCCRFMCGSAPRRCRTARAPAGQLAGERLDALDPPRAQHDGRARDDDTLPSMFWLMISISLAVTPSWKDTLCHSKGHLAGAARRSTWRCLPWCKLCFPVSDELDEQRACASQGDGGGAARGGATPPCPVYCADDEDAKELAAVARLASEGEGGPELAYRFERFEA